MIFIYNMNCDTKMLCFMNRNKVNADQLSSIINLGCHWSRTITVAPYQRSLDIDHVIHVWAFEAIVFHSNIPRHLHFYDENIKRNEKLMIALRAVLRKWMITCLIWWFTKPGSIIFLLKAKVLHFHKRFIIYEWSLQITLKVLLKNGMESP